MWALCELSMAPLSSGVVLVLDLAGFNRTKFTSVFGEP